MKNILSISFVLVLFSLSISCAEKEVKQDIPLKGEIIPVKVISLEKGKFSEEITASGNFTTRDETLLSFKVGGIVSKVYVNEGDAVKPSQLLATLDLTEIQAGLNQAKLAYEKALRDHRRAERLFKDSVATLEQLENSKTALDIALQQVKSAEFNLNFSQIRSAKNGFVLRKFVNSGQLVGSGTPILQINGAGTADWVLQATVNDLHWNQIQLGDSATLYPSNTKNGVPGKVIRKSQTADPLTGTYWVEISPEQGDKLNLAAGMFGKASITPAQPTEGWQIPFESVLDAQASIGFVFVTSDGKKAKKVQVQIGKISTTAVEVISGLENYGQLIVSGSAYLTDGSMIEIKKP
jgi:RND family efflux transporter MFP subunit